MRGWVITALAVGFLFGAHGPAPVLAGKGSNQPLSQKIERQRQTLQELKGEIREKKKSARAAEEKQRTVLGAIHNLDSRLMRYRQDRQDISRRLKQKDRQLDAINTQLDEVRSRIRGRRSSILARLRAQYMEGRFGRLKAILGADSYATFHRRVQYLSAVSQREFDLIKAYQRDLEHLEQVEQRRTEARQEMLRLKQDTEQKLGKSRSLRRHKRQLLAKITGQKESYERAAKELGRSAERVDALLKELEERRRVAAARASKLKTPKAFKGLFKWPADGKVVSSFGRQKHPNFDTYAQRKGIEILTEEGSAIRAVLAGQVVYADWLKGYGLVLILDHANGFFSLYAHASALLVKAGEGVETGQVIGETGDTGMTKDNLLYFELRQGAKPVDPLTWLARQ